MSKTFRPWDVDQIWLPPPSVQDFVPTGHLAHFVREVVCDGLDLSAIVAGYGEERGPPPYHPGMMVALLLYAYSRGVYSSRQIARGCEERLDFEAVTALNRPDFRTISDFRKRHLEALAGLFQQVLRLCRRAGLVGFGQQRRSLRPNHYSDRLLVRVVNHHLVFTRNASLGGGNNSKKSLQQQQLM